MVLHYVSHAIEGNTLTVRSSIDVDLRYRIDADTGILARSAEITSNTQPSVMVVRRKPARRTCLPHLGTSSASCRGAGVASFNVNTVQLNPAKPDANIRVNCISPGVIRTPFQNALTAAQVKNNIDNRIPLHREGTPEEVAQAIVALVENDFITGQDLVIDGGMTMRIV